MDRAELIRRRCDELKAENGDDRFFTGREIAELPKVLSPDESLLSLCSGLTDGKTWLVVLTDRRIVFLDKGMFWGMKEISVDLARVNSITHKAGLFLARIDVGDGARSYRIENVSKTAARSFATRANEALGAIARGESRTTGAEDRTGRLERLAELRRSGALDEDEFQREKRRLLDG